jgi:hypothetical protein
MSIAIILLNILYFSLTLPFAKAATDRFTDADSLSGFLGLFTGATNSVALLVSVGVANRLFARFGVPTAVLIFPLIYFVGFALLVITPISRGPTAVRGSTPGRPTKVGPCQGHPRSLLQERIQSTAKEG